MVLGSKVQGFGTRVWDLGICCPNNETSGAKGEDDFYAVWGLGSLGLFSLFQVWTVSATPHPRPES